MANEKIREMFDLIIPQLRDPEAKARAELMREYWSNPQFREMLADYVWEINQHT